MREFWKRFSRNKGAVVGLVVLIVVVILAIAAPFIFTKSPWAMVQRPFLPPFAKDGFLLGTDPMGRNLVVGVAHGARVSLLVGLVSTIVSLLIGIPIGALAGYFGGWVDDALMRFTEFFQSVPSFALAVVLVAIFQPSITSIVIAIAIVSWPPVARLLRGGGDVPQIPRICRGGGAVGPDLCDHHLAADPAQHSLPDHRPFLHDGGRRHPH